MPLYHRVTADLPTFARRLAALLTVSLLLLTASGSLHADDADDYTTATTVVDQLHARLLEAMQGGQEIGYNGRYEIMEPAVADLFDTPLIARVILGRHWDELDASQKDQFMQVFKKLSTATYANQFDRYSGERFEHVGIEQLAHGRILVRTEMLQGNGERVRFDYLMHEHNGNWYIISVVANGVNDLSLKRAEFASVIRSRGFEGLIRELEGKITEYESAVTS